MAPYQMFYSTPRWLLMRQPIYWQKPDGLEFDRYRTYLEYFLDELEQEELERNKDKSNLELQEKLSNFMRCSVTDGKFWFHELVYECFTVADGSPWKAICKIHSDFEELAPR